MSMTVEVIPVNNWECRAIQEAILKSAENLHLDPVSLAEQLITALDKVNKHYSTRSREIATVQITPSWVV